MKNLSVDCCAIYVMIYWPRNPAGPQYEISSLQYNTGQAFLYFKGKINEAQSPDYLLKST